MVILVIVLAVVMASAGAAYAASNYSKDVPTSGMILKANPGLTVYSDAACTVELTALTFPNVDAGAAIALPKVYVKNTGNKDFTTIGSTSDFNPTYGTITAAPDTIGGGLAKGANMGYTLTLSTLVNGVSGDTPFNCSVSFTGTY